MSEVHIFASWPILRGGGCKFSQTQPIRLQQLKPKATTAHKHSYLKAFGVRGHDATAATVSPSAPYIPIAPWLRRASPGPWWSTEKAFWTRSSCLRAKTEALGSIHYKLRVDVDERSAGGWRLEAVSRPRTASLSGTSNRGTRGRYGIHGGSLDEIRCVLHLPLTLIITHLCAASVLAGSC